MKYFIALTLLLVLSNTSRAQENYFPTREQWKKMSFRSINVDSNKIKQAISFAIKNEYSGSKDLRQAILKGFEREPFHKLLGPTKKRGGPAGMILKNGYLIAKWGDTERVDMTFSVTKSFLSTIAGLAIDKNLIGSVNDSVKKYVWDGTFEGKHNSKITWKHLLQQNSDWSGSLWGGADWADRPPNTGHLDDWKNRAFNEPGSVFEYNDVRVNVLAYALTQVWRKPLPVVLKQLVMDKIDASPTWRWYGYDNAFTIIDGLQMQSVTGGGHSGGGLFISTEDMARFGLLFLNNGKWKEEQIISKNWIEEVQKPSSSNSNYGYMWWLNKKGARHWEGITETIYYAAGFGGNFIIIDKKNDLVTVVRWLEPSKIDEFMKLLQASI